MLKPRLPTEHEMGQLREYILSTEFKSLTEYDREMVMEWIVNAAIAVYDNYITGGPGYFGKLMSVVWDGSPSFYSVYVWRDGKINHVDKES